MGRIAAADVFIISSSEQAARAGMLTILCLYYNKKVKAAIQGESTVSENGQAGSKPIAMLNKQVRE